MIFYSKWLLVLKSHNLHLFVKFSYRRQMKSESRKCYMFRPLVMFSKSLVIDMLFRNRSGPLLTIDKH